MDKCNCKKIYINSRLRFEMNDYITLDLRYSDPKNIDIWAIEAAFRHSPGWYSIAALTKANPRGIKHLCQHCNGEVFSLDQLLHMKNIIIFSTDPFKDIISYVGQLQGGTITYKD